MSSLPVSSRYRRLLVTDFDGTMTKRDFYECVMEEGLSAPREGAWQEYVGGEVSHFEALRRIFATLPADEEAVMQIARRTGLDPGLPAAVSRLRKHDWEVLVVSAGCDWYIQRLLKEANLQLGVISNPGRLVAGRGLELIPPISSPYFDAETGIDKAAVVRDALTEYEQVAFAGNGRADLAASLLVAPDMRFATEWLADQLQLLGESFHAFGTWTDLVEPLLASSRRPS